MESQLAILAAARGLGLSSPGREGESFRWIPASMYLFSALLCLLAGLAVRNVRNRRASSSLVLAEIRTAESPVARGPGPRFWWFMAAFLILFGIEREFDLLSMLTDYGRGTAKVQAWYGSRRTYQGAFILVIALLGSVVCAGLIWMFRRAGIHHHLAIGAFFSLSVFIAIRATSLHQVDSILGKQMIGLKLNWILELSGIIALAIAAVASIRVAGRTSFEQPGNRRGASVDRPPGR